MERALGIGSILLFAIWSIGQVARDRTVATALCFYVPSVLVAAALLLASIRARHARRPAWAAALVVLALVPGVTAATVESHWARPANAASAPTRSSRLRLVHWNIYGGLAGRRPVNRVLTRARGDLTVISELPPRRTLAVVVPRVAASRSIARRWQLAVIATGTLAAGDLERHGGARAWPLTWTPPGGEPIRVLVADLPSDLADPRGPHLAWLHERIAAHAPDLVVGDFNAPRRALGLASLPRGYAHAYERVGSGYSATFPVPAPLWAIDQTIVGPRVEPLTYDLQSTLASDHRLQRFEFAMAGEARRPQRAPRAGRARGPRWRAGAHPGARDEARIGPSRGQIRPFFREILRGGRCKASAVHFCRACALRICRAVALHQGPSRASSARSPLAASAMTASASGGIALTLRHSPSAPATSIARATPPS